MNWIQLMRGVASICRRQCSSSSAAASLSTPTIKQKVQPHAFQSFDITFLGTGGSNPSRARGMPSSLLDLGGEVWMFDAGEGTVRQSVYVRTCIMDTTRVFITHMHADHIFGLPGLIVHTGMKVKFAEPLPPLYVYGPYGLYELLKTTLRLSEATFTREIIVHEMIVSDEDSVGVCDKHGRSPWRKPASAYRPSSSALRVMNENSKNGTDVITSSSSSSSSSSFSDKISSNTASVNHRDQAASVDTEEDMMHKSSTKESASGGGSNIRQVLLTSKNGIWTCLDDPRVTVTAGLISHKIPCFGYIIKEVDKAGALLADECIKRGLHFKKFPDVKQGIDVMLDDGTIVKAEELTGEPLKGRKIVYLGDTSDASNLIDAAKDCDLLIHEATTDDARLKDCAKLGHATPLVAARMALRCNARRLVLNHIGSQFLPMGPGYRQRSVTDVRPDSDLAREAKRAFGRQEDVLLARDFVSLKIPMGGYTAEDDNTGFTDIVLSDGPFHTRQQPTIYGDHDDRAHDSNNNGHYQHQHQQQQHQFANDNSITDSPSPSLPSSSASSSQHHSQSNGYSNSDKGFGQPNSNSSNQHRIHHNKNHSSNNHNYSNNYYSSSSSHNSNTNHHLTSKTTDPMTINPSSSSSKKSLPTNHHTIQTTPPSRERSKRSDNHRQSHYSNNNIHNHTKSTSSQRSQHNTSTTTTTTENTSSSPDIITEKQAIANKEKWAFDAILLKK